MAEVQVDCEPSGFHHICALYILDGARASVTSLNHKVRKLWLIAEKAMSGLPFVGRHRAEERKVEEVHVPDPGVGPRGSI